jgi:hypothetical protein
MCETSKMSKTSKMGDINKENKILEMTKTG